MDVDPLEELRAEVRALQAEVAGLRRALHTAQTPPAPVTGAPVSGAPVTATPSAGATSPAPPAAPPGEVAPTSPYSRRRVLAGLAGAAGVGAGVAVVGSAATAGPAGAAPLTDGTTDLGEGLVDWSSANPATTLQLRNRGGGSALLATGASATAPTARLVQTNGAQPALAVRLTALEGTAAGLDVSAANHGNAISAQGTVVGVFGVGAVYGVEGQSFAAGGIGVAAGGPKAAMRLKAAGPAPGTRDEPYFGGEVVLDEDGTLWCCVAPGRPGTWREVASVRSAGVLHMVEPPVRIFDSRAGGGAPLGEGEERTITLPASVPATAQAATFNVTSTGASGTGFLTVYAAGTEWPGTTSVSFTGDDVTGVVLSALGSGEAAVRVVGSVTTHVAVDLVAWYG